ncbi:MAG: YigZ family protein [Candidatus Sedimenticola endophacoides]|uniref:YigZ family protein n=1 Tax=Candidatus Sedimenticola endophacoides TaxID=2548426 RepID=A0A6N4E153_9GAMM|nr:MAG: YigZ family protein [Candidatus Sedimenticola endophacoides]OQX36630.1 MAG: YigZ family protein [Candidatus Sedimenticola endophacoides]OQX41575.1 MAG: YigZ family protein [Candidatus Sedimenticola endophacoides]OQX45945.1 MAG: YigZ family protein [Candidatus Sedimenticola endophacoides]PUE01411.1 MAG: YigZ family protein [Candidatus Sedimenticola endophacoides]
MTPPYPVPAGIGEQTTEVKKSRFIARAYPVSDRASALRIVARVKREFPDARHHCWAYLLGNPAAASSAAMSDAGEPSGTAGRPILNVIQHKGIGDLLLVVVRYFGGIKLGAGGLARAYGGAAEAVLSGLPLTRHRTLVARSLLLDFAREQPLRHWLGQHDGEITSVDYDSGVGLRVTLDEAHLEALETFCQAHEIACHPSP